MADINSRISELKQIKSMRRSQGSKQVNSNQAKAAEHEQLLQSALLSRQYQQSLAQLVNSEITSDNIHNRSKPPTI